MSRHPERSEGSFLNSFFFLDFIHSERTAWNPGTPFDQVPARICASDFIVTIQNALQDSDRAFLNWLREDQQQHDRDP